MTGSSLLGDLAQMSYDVYDVEPTIVGVREDQNIHVLVIEQDGYLKVAFRGTKAPRDFALDFSLIPWNSQTIAETTGIFSALGALHAGFLHGAISVWPAVKERVISARQHNMLIALTGHSFGGAMALDTGAILKSQGIMVDRIVTFGAPRVGLDNCRRVLEPIPITEFRYGNDIVPNLPPQLIHMVTPTEIGEFHLDPLECHHMSGYLREVKKEAQ